MTSLDFSLHAPLIVSLLIFGGAAVWALSWSVKRGQFENFKHGAESIFDADEPVGRPTDRLFTVEPRED
jgi:cbb3-type cytochrome oxidase maturation protein